MAKTVRDGLVEMIDRALGDDPRQALMAARDLVKETEWLMQRAVALARREGFDWGRIGRNLGVTRQGARQKFPAAPPRQPPHMIRQAQADRDRLRTERLLKSIQDGTARRRYDLGDDPVAW